MRGKIIAFEGMDCSFKETNSKAYLEYLLSKGVKAALFSFPRYNNEASYFVREYLAGNYGDTKHLSTIAASTCYMMDMFDCMKKEIEPLLKEGYTIILDRYWYSNIYFRIGISRISNSYTPIAFILTEVDSTARELNLINADILVMLKSDPEVMLDFVHRKNSKKDQHENNDDLLLSVAQVFNSIDLKPYVTDGIVEIYTTKDGQIKSKEEIFNEIVRGIENV